MRTPIIHIYKRHFSSKKLEPFYSVLKVRISSTPEEIRESFLKLSRIYHPDNTETGDERKFIRLKEAYDKIKDGTTGTNVYEGDEKRNLSHKAYIDYLRKQPNSTILMGSISDNKGRLYSGVDRKTSWIDRFARKLTTKF